jgi:NTP pyrophosphatase (non-canonical NTP hydrolase)
MQLSELIERAMAVRGRYAEMEAMRSGRPWTREEIALGFVGDVGDLMKLIQAQEGIRSIAEADRKLAHELADCLWSVLVLSQLYGVDLESAFLQTMDDLEQYLTRGNW